MSLRWGVLYVECLYLMESSFMNGKNEMLEIFNEYHLNKYITSPCAPLVGPLHPTPDESIDMIRNLRTVNLITSGLPRNLFGCLPTLDCAYTIWRFLEERFPNYSLQNLDEILHKSIALSKMNSNDPKFGDCPFELTNSCVPKEMLESLAISSPKPLEFINMTIVMTIYIMNCPF